MGLRWQAVRAEGAKMLRAARNLLPPRVMNGEIAV